MICLLMCFLCTLRVLSRHAAPGRYKSSRGSASGSFGDFVSELTPVPGSYWCTPPPPFCTLAPPPPQPSPLQPRGNNKRRNHEPGTSIPDFEMWIIVASRAKQGREGAISEVERDALQWNRWCSSSCCCCYCYCCRHCRHRRRRHHRRRRRRRRRRCCRPWCSLSETSPRRKGCRRYGDRGSKRGDDHRHRDDERRSEHTKSNATLFFLH